MTLRRVMPSSRPTDSGGVETQPPRTMKKLDELPSVMRPTLSHRIAS